MLYLRDFYFSWLFIRKGDKKNVTSRGACQEGMPYAIIESCSTRECVARIKNRSRSCERFTKALEGPPMRQHQGGGNVGNSRTGMFSHGYYTSEICQLSTMTFWYNAIHSPLLLGRTIRRRRSFLGSFDYEAYRKTWRKQNPDRMKVQRAATYLRFLERLKAEAPELYEEALRRAQA